MKSRDWIPARSAAEMCAVSASVLFRYAQRGMIGARWDEPTNGWAYDARRMRALFLPKAEVPRWLACQNLGVLGESRLGTGAEQRRKPPVRREQETHVDSSADVLCSA